MLVFQIPVTDDSFYLTFLQLLNGVGKLTAMELRVAAYLLPYGTVTVQTRELACEELKLTMSSLNNYIKILRDKQLLVDNKFVFIPDKTGLSFQFIW